MQRVSYPCYKENNVGVTMCVIIVYRPLLVCKMDFIGMSSYNTYKILKIKFIPSYMYGCYAML